MAFAPSFSYFWTHTYRAALILNAGVVMSQGEESEVLELTIKCSQLTDQN